MSIYSLFKKDYNSETIYGNYEKINQDLMGLLSWILFILNVVLVFFIIGSASNGFSWLWVSQFVSITISAWSNYREREVVKVPKENKNRWKGALVMALILAVPVFFQRLSFPAVLTFFQTAIYAWFFICFSEQHFYSKNRFGERFFFIILTAIANSIVAFLLGHYVLIGSYLFLIGMLIYSHILKLGGKT